MQIRKKILESTINNWWIKSIKEEKQLWTNCEGFLVNFIKKWKRVRYFMKKTFVLWENKEDVEKDYLLLKKYFKNIIPNTVFIEWKDKNIFSFSDPIIIDFDLLNTENEKFIKTLLKDENNYKIIKKIQFFIRKFELLIEEEWKILDLYWKENLVFTKDWNVKYIDNFKVFYDNELIKKESLKKIGYLKSLIRDYV